MRRLLLQGCSLLCGFGLAFGIPACTTILVGSKATTDGSVIIARNDDGESAGDAQHVVVHPAKTYATGSLFHSTVSAFTYPMPRHALKYLSTPQTGTHDRSHEESGINSLNVGLSATETIYNSQAALKDDPYVANTGVNEDSIASILLPRIHSARDGIRLLGKIIETRGTDEGFGVAIADTHHIWYLETASGHQWVAMRIPDDQCFVSANQARIQSVNLNDSKNFLASPGLIHYAIKHHLYLPEKGPFNFRRAFAKFSKNDVNYNYSRLSALFKLYSPNTHFNRITGTFPTLIQPLHRMSVLAVMQGLQNYYQQTQHDPYSRQNPSEPWRPISVFRTKHSHIIVLQPNSPAAVAGVEYVAFGMPSLSLYVPFFSGLNNAPKRYDMGTTQADDNSMFWYYRKMQTLTMMNFPLYAPWVQTSLLSMQKKFIVQVNGTVKQYSQHPSQALLQQSIHHFTAESLAVVRRLTNKIFTQLANNVKAKYNFSGA